MKKILLCLFFCSLFGGRGAFAQTNVYHPFPDSGAVWTVDFRIWPCLFSINPHEEQFSYFISGDTIIGSFTYHKLVRPFIQEMNSFCLSQINIPGYIGCFRQDTSARKVFYIQPNDTLVDLLYDFNMQVGDTVRGFSQIMCPSYPNTVIGTDSTLVGLSYRKRWLVSFGGFTKYLIEGIGSTEELLTSSCGIPDEPETRITCFIQNGVVLYTDSIFPCQIIDAVKNIAEEKISVVLSPNPFHTIAVFSFRYKSQTQNLTLSIYNTLGMLVRKVSLSFKEGRGEVNRNGLPDGLYFYQLTTENEQVATGKLVIE